MLIKYTIAGVVIGFMALGLQAQPADTRLSGSPDGKVLFAYGRYIQPAGEQIVFGEKDRENHALDCALSADEKWLVVEERTSLYFLNTATRQIAYRFPSPGVAGDASGSEHLFRDHLE